MKKIINNIKVKQIIVLAIVFMTIFISALFLLYNKSNYVAKVGSNKISKAEFSFFLLTVSNEMEEEANISGNEKAKEEFWKSKIAGKDSLEIAKERALKRLLDVEILYIKANEAGIKLTEEEINEIDSAILKKTTDAEKKSLIDRVFLEKHGMEEYSNVFKKLKTIYNYGKYRQEKINVSEKEIETFYKNNRDKVDKVKARHIIFSTIDNDTGLPLSQQQQNESKNLAYDVLEKVKNKEDFGKLVEKYTEDPFEKQNKGIYFVEHSGENSNIVEEFKVWALSHYPEDVEVVKSRLGYHVIKIEDRTDFDSDGIKEKAKEKLREKIFEEMLNEWKRDPKYSLVKNNSVLEKFN